MFSCIKHRLLKRRNIYTVRKILRLQTQCMTLIIRNPIFSFLWSDTVSCVKLHTRKIGIYFHRDAGAIVFYLGNLFQFSMILQYPVMIITLYQCHLFKVRIHFVSHTF